MTDKSNQLTTINQPGDRLDHLAAVTAGQAANDAAAAWAFSDYRGRKSANTLRNHDAALDHLAGFLVNHGAAADDLTGAALASDPAAWHGVTWGLIEGWKVGQLNQGYSIGTVNNRLSAARVYAGLASKAGIIPADELTLIKAVEGYGVTEGKRVDEKRPRSRVGAKKAAAVSLTLDQARRLKRPANATGQAARDSLIMTLLLNHGLRVGELAGLTVEAIDLETGMMTFYRPKVDMIQNHSLTSESYDSMPAVRRYLAMRPAGAGSSLWVASDRRGRLLARPMSTRAIAKRVNLLGLDVGAVGLSPHDCRHYWTTQAIASGTPVDIVIEAGGWSSPAMAYRYKKAGAVANAGIILIQ